MPPITGAEIAINTAEQADSVVKNLTDKESEHLLKALQRKNEKKESTENTDTTFLGIPLEDITDNQKILFDTYKNDKESMTRLSKITHNRIEGQFEFQEAKLALSDKDIAQNMTKKSTDKAIKKLGDGWKLPSDVDYGQFPEKQNKLNSEESDFDKMIMDMPGANDNKKVENFRLLTGVSQRYWTAQNYNKSSSEFVIRRFDKGNRNRTRDYDYSNGRVRGVRPL